VVDSSAMRKVRMKGRQLPWIILITAVALASPVRAQEERESNAAAVAAEFDGEAVFHQLKAKLVGNWKGVLQPAGRPVEATFYLSGNGSALVEDIRRLDKDFRMLSVYHLDGNDIRATHFCSFQNQPRFRAASVSPDGRTIDFEFVDITNLARSGDRYTFKIVVSVIDDRHVSITYHGRDHGEEGSLTAELTRT